MEDLIKEIKKTKNELEIINWKLENDCKMSLERFVFLELNAENEGKVIISNSDLQEYSKRYYYTERKKILEDRIKSLKAELKEEQTEILDFLMDID